VSYSRWLTPDPGGEKVVTLADPQTWNMYSYVRDNPLTRTDPSGLCSVDNEQHGWLWCAAHSIGFVTTLTERRDWVARNLVLTDRSGKRVPFDWSKASSAQVNAAYNYGRHEMALEATEIAVSPLAFVLGQYVSSLGPQGAAAVAGMLGASGPQFTSKTLWNDGGARIDVENPAPGERPGQIHYQDATGKYIYDTETGQFTGLSQTKNAQLLSRAEVQDAIQKGLKYLGQ